MITRYGFGRVHRQVIGETRDLRAQWALEETGLPYRVHALDHTDGDGAWHVGWCWGEVSERLAASGVHSVAIDLHGHAMGAAFPVSYFDVPQDFARLSAAVSPLAGLTLNDCRQPVSAAVNGLVVNDRWGGFHKLTFAAQKTRRSSSQRRTIASPRRTC